MTELTPEQIVELMRQTFSDNITEVMHEIESIAPYHNIRILDCGFDSQNGNMVKTIQLIAKG